MSIKSSLLLIVLAALWGGSFAFMRYAVAALGPLPLAFARVTLAATVLLLVAVAQRRKLDLASRWRGLAVVGIVNSAIPFVLFCYAEQYITASTGAVLNATSPFFGAVCAAIWLGEPLTTRKIGGMALGLAGVAVLVGWHPEAINAQTAMAIAACLAASLCYGLGGVYAKRRMQGVLSFDLALGSQAAAAMALVFFVPAATIPGPVTYLVIANVLGLAIASTAVAYVIYFKLIADLGPARALTVTFLIPLFGVLWGALFLGEAVTPALVTGGVLIVAGTVLTLRGGRPRGVVSPAP